MKNLFCLLYIVLLSFLFGGCKDFEEPIDEPLINNNENNNEEEELDTLPSTTKILWGIGDNFTGAKSSALLNETSIKLVSHWYNGPQDMSWIRGYKNQTTVSDIYAQGYGIQLIVWLAQNRETADYAIGDQFQDDIKELTEIFKGNGPNYGPLYIVLFTELETYPPSGEAAAENYKKQLSAAYIKAAGTIHDTYDKAWVGLGLGGYHWPQAIPGTRDITRWDEAIEASDFTCVQQMQSYKNWQQIPGKTRNAVSQLGTYNKPVMVSHFKIWSGGPDDNPDPIDKKIADAQGAFDLFMDDMFTNASLDALYADGLRAWVFMNDEYIRKHGDEDKVYLRAKNFVSLHNEENPVMKREYTPTLPPGQVDVLLSYDFNGSSLEPVINNAGTITASGLNNHNLSFELFSTQGDPHTSDGGKWIRDHGQGADHINALTENEAVNINSGNQKNNYLSFTISPSDNKKLDLYWFTFDIQARTGAPDTPPELTYFAALYTCKDGIINHTGKTVSVSSNTENSVSGWVTAQFDISKMKFAGGEVAEFRIYVWRVGSTNQRSERWLEFDNIKVHGYSR
ncbi:hypothetical protein [Dysgonomonas termitidis]|uniref:DUF4832 domain-containing protein n=1 Tax=Dysgonomonas termitidis TaxID=1516126 RepID=A0ABV9L0S6_9BACT